jgi:pleiotropic regulator 1
MSSNEFIFDSRFITCEADKTIKIWKEIDDATEDTHPIDMTSWTKHCQALKRY